MAAAALHEVLAPFHQAGVFQHFFQNHLAPVALAFVAAAGEGLGEGLGVLVQPGVELLQAFELVFQREPLFGFFFVGVLYELAEALQFFAQGMEQLVELLAVLLGKTAAFFFEDLVGEVLELFAQVLAGLVEQDDLFGVGLLLLFDLGLYAFVLQAAGGQLLAGGFVALLELLLLFGGFGQLAVEVLHGFFGGGSTGLPALACFLFGGELLLGGGQLLLLLLPALGGFGQAAVEVLLGLFGSHGAGLPILCGLAGGGKLLLAIGQALGGVPELLFALLPGLLLQGELMLQAVSFLLVAVLRGLVAGVLPQPNDECAE